MIVKISSKRLSQTILEQFGTENVKNLFENIKELMEDLEEKIDPDPIELQIVYDLNTLIENLNISFNHLKLYSKKSENKLIGNIIADLHDKRSSLFD